MVVGDQNFLAFGISKGIQCGLGGRAGRGWGECRGGEVVRGSGETMKQAAQGTGVCVSRPLAGY